VAERRVDFESKSVVNIAPEHGDEVVNVSTEAGEWLQGLLGTSEYHRQLGYNHSLIMNNKYKLNAQYRRRFMISPTVPWRDADAGGAKTLLQLVQFSISAVMLSLDTRIAGIPTTAQDSVSDDALCACSAPRRWQEQRERERRGKQYPRNHVY